MNQSENDKPFDFLLLADPPFGALLINNDKYECAPECYLRLQKLLIKIRNNNSSSATLHLAVKKLFECEVAIDNPGVFFDIIKDHIDKIKLEIKDEINRIKKGNDQDQLLMKLRLKKKRNKELLEWTELYITKFIISDDTKKNEGKKVISSRDKFMAEFRDGKFNICLEVMKEMDIINDFEDCLLKKRYTKVFALITALKSNGGFLRRDKISYEDVLSLFNKFLGIEAKKFTKDSPKFKEELNQAKRLIKQMISK